MREVDERIKPPLLGCLACVSGLTVLAALTYQAEPFTRRDAEVLGWLSAPSGSFVEGIAEVAMRLADPLPLLAALAVVCGLGRHWGRRRETLAALALVAGANLTTQVLKAALSHPRYQPLLGYRQVGSASFPSGHATGSLSIALALVLVAPRPWHLAALLAGSAFALAVSCSVLVLNRHFPSDVLGGWLVTGAWFFAVLVALQPRFSERREML